MIIRVKAKINPSEDPEKVENAIKNIFPSIDIETTESYVKGKSKGLKPLENLRNKLGLQAIRDTARKRLQKGKSEDSLNFYLNKQAATVDKVSFSDGETPLGSIEVSIKSKKSNKLVDYLAPSKDER